MFLICFKMKEFVLCHYTTLCNVMLHSVTIHQVTLCCIAFQCIVLRWHCTAVLHCSALLCCGLLSCAVPCYVVPTIGMQCHIKECQFMDWGMNFSRNITARIASSGIIVVRKNADRRDNLQTVEPFIVLNMFTHFSFISFNGNVFQPHCRFLQKYPKLCIFLSKLEFFISDLIIGVVQVYTIWRPYWCGGQYMINNFNKQMSNKWNIHSCGGISDKYWG